SGFFPSIIGLSWFGVLIISISPLSSTSHAHPDPKRPVAAVVNSSLNLSKLPNLAFILSASSPLGSPLPLGLNVFQKKLWLACPPPLLRTAVRIYAGTLSKSLIKSSTDFDFKSACPSTAPFNFVTYVLWCFVCCIFIVSLCIDGSNASYAYGNSGNSN